MGRRTPGWLLMLALLACGGGAGWADPAPVGDAGARLAQATAGDRTHLDGHFSNVKRLLEASSGAKRVQAGNDPLAKKIHEDALERYRKAEAARDAGDDATARRLLDEAAKTLFQAVRMLGPAVELVDKKIGEFDGRVTSTQVLLKALQRIAAEEGTAAAAAKTAASVGQTIAAARALLDAGHYDAARRLLDGGYEQAKAAVESLRDGKTLVRSLTFATPEAEYRYELDRNDTHHMLVRVVLQEKTPGAQAVERVEQSMARAATLRGQAEQQATAGHFAEAIELLDQSTKELVRAIRGAGLYIPG